MGEFIYIDEHDYPNIKIYNHHHKLLKSINLEEIKIIPQYWLYISNLDDRFKLYNKYRRLNK